MSYSSGTVTIIVCRIGEAPVVDEVFNPFKFTQSSLLKGGYIEAKLVELETRTRVVFYWDEDAERKDLPFNRSILDRAKTHPAGVEVIDLRKGSPEKYAAPGEVGYFPIRGPFIVTKADDDGNHISLDPKEIEVLMAMLSLQTCTNCQTKVVAYPGAKFCGAACSQAYEIKKGS